MRFSGSIVSHAKETCKRIADSRVNEAPQSAVEASGGDVAIKRVAQNLSPQRSRRPQRYDRGWSRVMSSFGLTGHEV